MTGNQATIQITDANGELLNVGVLIETNPMLVQFLATLQAPAGSAGVDWSVGDPTAPLIGQTLFGGASSYADWVLLQTVPANFGACERSIRNLSASPILVALDDGHAGPGSSPENSHLFILNPSSNQTGQFSPPNETSFVSERFKGRIRVFCPESSAWVAILEV